MTLRTRMVLLAAVVVAVILTAAGLVLSWGLRQVLIRNAVNTAQLRARDLASLVERSVIPDPIPITSEDQALAQVVSGEQVTAASANVRGAAPLDLPRQRPNTEAVNTASRLPVDDPGMFRVVALGVDAPLGPATVYVAVSLEEIDDIVTAAARLGLAGLPLLVAALSAALWVLIGRTLAPVDAIGAEAAVISGTDMHRRVPEPARDDEIGRLARIVNAMLDRLEDSAARQRRFVADAAHELRNPIASQRAQLETTRDAARPVDWRRVNADLLAETLRMQTLTEQLLLLARVDAGRVYLHRVAVDIDDLVRQHTTATLQRHPDLTITTSEVSPTQIVAEPVLLGQVVANLLDNAARHAKTEVVVALSMRQRSAILIIDDDGAGIPPERRAVVFDRFTRLDEARDRDHGGTGLGLAIVADVVALHGGTVDIDCAPIGGARFTVRLPVGE